MKTQCGFSAYSSRVRALLVSIGCKHPYLSYQAIIAYEAGLRTDLMRVIDAWSKVFGDEGASVREAIAKVNRAVATKAERALGDAMRNAIKARGRAINAQRLGLYLQQRIDIASPNGKRIARARQRDHVCRWKITAAVGEDEGRAVLARMIDAWSKVFGDEGASVREAIAKVNRAVATKAERALGDAMRDAIMDSARVISAERCGMWMSHHEKQNVGTKQIVRSRQRDHVALWKVETMNTS